MLSSPSNVNHLEPAQSKLSEISSKRTKEHIEWLRDLSKEDKQALRQTYQQKLGDLVSWAFMLACLQQSNRNESTDEQKRVEKWTEEHFRAKLSTILQESPLKSTLMSETQVESLIEKYIETIGDVEQTLPGENTELDEYLLKY